MVLLVVVFMPVRPAPKEDLSLSGVLFFPFFFLMACHSPQKMVGANLHVRLGHNDKALLSSGHCVGLLKQMMDSVNAPAVTAISWDKRTSDGAP